MAAFLHVWLIGYFRPTKFAEALRGRPAPQWGAGAQLLRGVLDALLLYLPLHLLGHTPPTPSYLPFLPTETYYGALAWLSPLTFTAQWLLGGGVIHVLLRLSGQPSDYDQVLNLTGMANLIVGALLLVWDWLWIIVGGMNQYLLGYSHLLIDIWGAVLIAVGLRKLLGVPVWLGVLAYVLAIAAGLPLAIMFMRSPL